MFYRLALRTAAVITADYWNDRCCPSWFGVIVSFKAYENNLSGWSQIASRLEVKEEERDAHLRYPRYLLFKIFHHPPCSWESNRLNALHSWPDCPPRFILQHGIQLNPGSPSLLKTFENIHFDWVLVCGKSWLDDYEALTWASSLPRLSSSSYFISQW